MTRFFYAFSLGIKPDRFLKPVGFALSDANRVLIFLINSENFLKIRSLLFYYEKFLNLQYC